LKNSVCFSELLLAVKFRRGEWSQTVFSQQNINPIITSITRNVGGKGDVSTFIKSAKNSALTEVANNGADSYFIVSAESTSFGALVTLEALRCK
jgi:hypothetical protein